VTQHHDDDPTEIVRTAGARLGFVERGAGPPVVLLHGSLTDLRYWQRSGLLDALAQSHRVIAPSRRHSHPNAPTAAGSGFAAGAAYAAHDDAADLLELLDALRIGSATLLGHSYGAYAALLATIAQPERVSRLILAEPPLMRWLPFLPDGEGIWERFESGVWQRLGDAFRAGGDDAGLDLTAKWYFQRPFAEIEEAWREAFRDNVREWRALTTSSDAFPFVPFDAVAALDVPTLLLSGGQNAGGFNDLIDRRLAELIPGSRRVTVDGASHEMFLDAPEVVARTVAAFLREEPPARVSDAG
jgi:non-heme chloroperoxidase